MSLSIILIVVFCTSPRAPVAQQNCSMSKSERKGYQITNSNNWWIIIYGTKPTDSRSPPNPEFRATHLVQMCSGICSIPWLVSLNTHLHTWMRILSLVHLGLKELDVKPPGSTIWINLPSRVRKKIRRHLCEESIEWTWIIDGHMELKGLLFDWPAWAFSSKVV